MPSPRRANFDAFYTCQHADQFRIDWRGFYQRSEVRTDDVRSRWAHALDIAYGPSERQRLDLYLPVFNRPVSSPSTAWPVLVFLHGGGFREGDPALYGYLAEPFLSCGIAFISAGYRLTPEAYLPETFGDIEALLAWCVTHLPDRGIDTTRLALAGHSAGAILTAHLAVRSNWLVERSLPTDLIKAAIPISGIYDFTSPDQRREFFTDASDRVASSPLRRLEAATIPPMLVAYGSDEDRPTYGIDSRLLVDAVRVYGGRAELQELEGMTHKDTVDALGDASSPLFESAMRLLVSAGVVRAEAAVQR